MSSGNAVGTWKVFASCRTVGAIPGSNSASSASARADTFENAELTLRGWGAKKFKPVAFFRGQEPLGWVDAILHLHGFVILMLEHEENGRKKYVRLDWGSDGLLCQVQDSVDDFTTYGGDENAKKYVITVVEEAKCPLRTVTEILIWEGAIVIISRAAGAAAFYLAAPAATAAEGAAVGAAVGPWGMAVGGGLALVASGVVGAVQIAKHMQTAPEIELSFRPTKTDASMNDVADILEKVQNEAYDLGSWNCNHFANEVVSSVE